MRCIQLFLEHHLKSNMDRFIVRLEESIIRSRRNLKSNMDRFIVLKEAISLPYVPDLKSNMDRFIDFRF